MTVLSKPLPPEEELHGEFYAFCGKHELRFQCCSECSAWRHMPRECCAQCGSFEWSWKASSGKGALFSWTVVHRALHPAFEEDVPYAIAVVELEEGVRLATRLEDVSLDNLSLGLPLRVDFEDVAPGIALHFFRTAEQSQNE